MLYFRPVYKVWEFCDPSQPPYHLLKFQFQPVPEGRILKLTFCDRDTAQKHFLACFGVSAILMFSHLKNCKRLYIIDILCVCLYASNCQVRPKGPQSSEMPAKGGQPPCTLPQLGFNPQGHPQQISQLIFGFVSKPIQNMFVWKISERGFLIKQ